MNLKSNTSSRYIEHGWIEKKTVFSIEIGSHFNFCIQSQFDFELNWDQEAIQFYITGRISIFVETKNTLGVLCLFVHNLYWTMNDSLAAQVSSLVIVATGHKL